MSDQPSVMGRIRNLQAMGVDLETAIIRVMGRLETREPRFRCRLCQDSGLVTVWASRSMAEYRAGELRCQHTAAVACECKAGDKFVGDREPRKMKSHPLKWPENRRYTSDRYCLASKSLDEFRTWCAAYFEHREQRELEAMSNFQPELALWNES